jgi:hypothetical protein
MASSVAGFLAAAAGVAAGRAAGFLPLRLSGAADATDAAAADGAADDAAAASALASATAFLALEFALLRVLDRDMRSLRLP